MYNNIRWNNYQRLWLEQWHTAEKQEMQNIYGCDANNLRTNEIKSWIEYEKGWEQEDDRTNEKEEWEEYVNKDEAGKQQESAVAAIERIRMTRTIAKNQLWYKHCENREET